MDDGAFSGSVRRLFDEAPPFPDTPLFALEVERRIARRWALRRLLIIAAGVSGGVLAVAQTLGSGLMERLARAPRLLETVKVGLLQAGGVSRLSALELPYAGEILWLVVGLIVLALALLVGRRIDGV